MNRIAGYRERAHTADWELEVWAPDLAGLLEQAAHGLYAISGTQLKAGDPHTHALDLHALDAEGLLVRFLSELLWLGQQDGLAFNSFAITLQPGWHLHAELSGASIASIAKEVKAVTYHNLVIRQRAQGLVVNIVFDV